MSMSVWSKYMMPFIDGSEDHLTEIDDIEIKLL